MFPKLSLFYRPWMPYIVCMHWKKGQILDVEISDLAFGGRGVAKPDGVVIFVDQAAPLDRMKVRITRKRKNYLEARPVELLQPSPFRTEPPCPYSGTCGGCKCQFLQYDRQLEYKRRQVSDALERIGQITDAAVHPTIASPAVFHYRNKMEFTCSDRRWLMTEELGRPEIDMGFALGLHVPGTFDKVLDIRTCLIQPAFGNELLAQVRQYIRESELPAYGLRSHQGFWRFVVLRHSRAYDQWMVNIVTAAEQLRQVRPLAERLAGEYPDVVSIVNNITARKAGVAVGEREVQLFGNSRIRDRIGPYEFEISANSFFQTNTAAAERLYDIVRDYARLGGRERVVDLYCGTGTISIWLSHQAAEVVGLELSESAVADARENCRRNRIDNCRFIEGDILDTLADIEAPPDVMVIDPPRAGMHKHVVRQLMDMGPPRIVYVSCNPATLARDLLSIKEQYRVLEVQPVDMFPHTFHIEAVARLERRAG